MTGDNQAVPQWFLAGRFYSGVFGGFHVDFGA
jgi:hypothetical protein